jgi:hypothetical protein
MSTTTYGLIDGELSTDLLGVVTPAELMTLAEGGVYSKAALAGLLTPAAKYEFLAACAAIELSLTDGCIATKDFCLESGCAVEGEVCLEAVLKAGTGYPKAYATKWIAIFSNPANRIEAWRR